MDVSLLGFAVGAGLVAALNPCGFAMLPAYLSLVVLGGERAPVRRRGGVVARALTATALMALGFVLVFATFGLIVTPLASTLQRYLPWVTVAIGAAMVVLGIWLLAGRQLTLLLPRSGRGAPTAALSSMIGYGVAYALASLSCTIGPFLAVSAGSFGTGSIVAGVAGYLAYALGMTLTVGVLAVTVALAGQGAAARARRLLPYVHRASGVLLVVVGVYVGYYGVYDLRQDAGGTTTSDPIIDAAGVVQQAISNTIDALGADVIAVALGVLILGAALTRYARRRRRSVRDSDETATTTNTEPPAHP